MNQNWNILDAPLQDELSLLKESLKCSQITATLLWQRGIKTFEEARDFFNPDLTHLHDSFLMKDMDLAVNRIIQANQIREKVMIFGDYDVDGTTSVTMMYHYLKHSFKDICYYIPDRYKEGYGVSIDGIDYAKQNGVTLIVTLDCGIRSVDKVDYAKSLGIDFIICDHHEPGEELPEAIAILNPKQKDCAYPFKELCGCGVGFKLIQAIQTRLNVEIDIWNYLDLVAIAIAADIVPMIGENRVMASIGIQQINKQKRYGIEALLTKAGFNEIKNINNIVFGIGPRINAAGRIAHAKFAVELLLADSEEKAIDLAKKVEKHNLERKDVDASITEEALAMIEKSDTLAPLNATVLYQENWHKGVIGIVASRCIEKYYRPTVILTKSGNYATGSARSVKGFDLYEAIASCSQHLIQFGGHTYAAGLTMEVDQIDLFRQAFENYVSNKITVEQKTPTIQIDMKVAFNELTQKVYNTINRMAPFGPMHHQPIFVTENVQDTGYVRLLKDKHLKLTLSDGTTTMQAIAFDMAEYFERIKKGHKFRVCYTLEENTFRDITNLQLMVRDIKFDS